MSDQGIIMHMSMLYIERVTESVIGLYIYTYIYIYSCCIDYIYIYIYNIITTYLTLTLPPTPTIYPISISTPILCIYIEIGTLAMM